MNTYRLPRGGRIDRSKPLGFRFNGRDYRGYAGDTLASALLANGVGIVGRSVKYHRPRGVMSAGIEESNALVQLRGKSEEPSLQATRLALFAGLEARSINCWPSVNWDLGALNNGLARFIPAGFYYKTFMARRWDFYAGYIRRMAGLGRAAQSHDPDEKYEKRYHHCDVLVVGAGPAGLAAALAAGRAGARVLLVDDQCEAGGALLNEAQSEQNHIADQAAPDWVAGVVAELATMADVIHLQNTVAAGYYDHNMLTVVESEPAENWLRERLWRVRAKQVVIAAGAVERPLVFADNDRPGIMLAGSIRAYLNRYAVRCGRTAVVMSNNNSAYASAFDLSDQGVAVAAIVDTRKSVDPQLQAEAEKRNIPLYQRSGISAVHGGRRVKALEISPLSGGNKQRISCDLVCHSGGWNPLVHLHSQSGAKPVYDNELACFVPGPAVQAERTIGAARGMFMLADCLRDGIEAGTAAAEAAGYKTAALTVPVAGEMPALAVGPAWELPAAKAAKAFVDFQNDVTAADLRLALRENYASIEQVKRYTTAGMATDQGKTGNANVIGIIAQQLGVEPGAVGTTTYRPPYKPVSFGVLAGRDREQLILPARHTPITQWNMRHGAAMNEAGAFFRRPFYYPEPGESLFDATMREARAVRTSAGIYDSSPLGKFMLDGPDAVTLLNRVYTNRWDDLAIGQGRFGLMLREDGKLLDDGVTFRLAEQQYLVSAGTGAADSVYAHLERLLQCEWPDLKVYITVVSAQWADICICGPKAREILQRAGADFDLSTEAFPFLAIRSGKVAGFDARVARVSYTGELSFEIYVRSRHGEALWQAMMAAGQDFAITPVGSETSAVLRIEKGFVSAATEGDHLTNPFDAGMRWVVDMDKEDFIGRRSLMRDLNVGGERQQVVGLRPLETEFVPAEGSALIEPVSDDAAAPPEFLGHVTAACYSPNLNCSIALALLKNGRRRLGEIVTVSGLERTVQAEVTRPVFIDPKGIRMRS